MSLESISLLGQQQQGEIKNEDRHVATDPLPSPRLFASLAALSRREKFNAETLMMILRLLPKGNCELVDPAQVKPQAKRLAESHTRQMKRVAVSPVTVLVYNDEEACHWSVGIFRSGLHTIHYFDSMSSLGVEAKARQACLGTLEWLGISVKDIVWEAKVTLSPAVVQSSIGHTSLRDTRAVSSNRMESVAACTSSRMYGQSLPPMLCQYT